MGYTFMRDGETVAAKKAAAAGLLASTPAVSAAPKRLTMDQLISQGKVGRQVFDPLYQQLGNTGWATDGGVNEAGQALTLDTPNTDAYKQLQGYTFDWADTGAGNTGTLTAYDPSGKQIGAYQQQDSSGWDAFKDYAIMGASALGGLGAIGLGPLSGLLGGASGASAGSAAAGAADIGALGLAEGVYGAGGALGAGAVPGTVGGLAGSTAAFGGLGSMLPAGVSFAAPGALAGAGLELSTVGGPDPAGVVPNTAPPQEPAIFNAAADSQLASQQLGITGAQSAAAATAPATVNLGSLGGTMGTAGGLEGLLAEVKQGVSGGLLGDASAWMKANPVLGRLLTSGATTLLSGMGGSSGSSGGSSGAAVAPTPTKWNSPIQQGLLSNVQQYAPPAVQRSPGGLLAQGFQNDGAWRYMGG